VAASAKKETGGHCTVATIAKHHCPVSQVMAKEPEIVKTVEQQSAQQVHVSANAFQDTRADIVKPLCRAQLVLETNHVSIKARRWV